MKLNLKKSLLAGTAVLAMGAFVAPTVAQAQAVTLTADDTFQDGMGDAGAAADGASIDLDGFDLTIDTNSENDAGNDGSFSLGDITDSATSEDMAGDVTVIGDFDAATGTVTINSLDIEGDFLFRNANTDGTDVDVTIDNAASIGGTLTIVNNEATNPADLELIFSGTLDVTGTTDVTAGDVAGANSILIVDGVTTFNDDVTITGGGDADADAYLTVGGASVDFAGAGGLTLTDATGQAFLELDSTTTAQTVTGDVSGDGHVIISNALGATFEGSVQATDVTVEGGSANSSATFENTVDAAVILGTDGNMGDVNTVTFDTTNNDYNVTGTITGTAGETNNVVVSGTGTLTQDAAIGAGGEIDAVTVSGTSTLDSDAAISATTITIGSDATLDLGAGAVTGAVANAGTINFTGTGGIVGNVTGAGDLDVDADTTIDGDVAASTANVETGSTLTIDAGHDYVVDTTTLDGTGTLTIGNGDLTGDVVAAMTGEGTVNFSDAAATQAITGDIGTDTVSVGALNILGAGSANVVTTTGNLYVDAIAADDADTLRFIGTSDQVVSGTITGGILELGDGSTDTDVSLNGVASSLASVLISDDARLNANADVTTDGALTLDGTLFIDTGVTVTADTLTRTGAAGEENKFVIEVTNTSGVYTNGTFAQGTGAIDLTNYNVELALAGDGIDASSTVTVQDVFTGTGAATGPGSLTDTFLFDFELVDDGNNLDLTIDLNNNLITSFAGTSQAGVARVVNSFVTGGSTNSDIQALITSISNAANQDEAEQILESLTPNVNGSSVLTVTGVAGEASATVDTRLASIRNGDAVTGMATGNMSHGLKMWGQVFGSTGDHDERGGVAGYDYDTLGLAFGIDTENMHKDVVFGASFAYADTNADSDNINNTDVDIDSYILSLYGQYQFNHDMYLDGLVSYGFNDIDQTRENVGGIGNATAIADYDSDQINIRAELGKDIHYSDGMKFTPHVDVDYIHVNTDDYTEEGAGGLNQTVDTDNYGALELGVGATVAWQHRTTSGVMQPSLSANYRYEVLDDDVETTSSFAGGGAAFGTDGMDPADHRFDVGGSLKYYSQSNWEFTADYQYDFRADFDAHSGMLRAGYKF